MYVYTHIYTYSILGLPPGATRADDEARLEGLGLRFERLETLSLASLGPTPTPKK